MTGKERMERVLRREPVDQVPVHEGFWEDTMCTWRQQGHLQEDEIAALLAGSA